MATKNKSVLILLLFILCGLVVGGFLGELASKVDFLWWVSYGEEFGISSPVTIDLSIIKLTIGFMFKINISSIIGLILAIFIYIKRDTICRFCFFANKSHYSFNIIVYH